MQREPINQRQRSRESEYRQRYEALRASPGNQDRFFLGGCWRLRSEIPAWQNAQLRKARLAIVDLAMISVGLLGLILALGQAIRLFLLPQ